MNDQYLLGRVLGQGDFGITYLAWDMNLERKIAIKEYFPSPLATRRANQSTITIYSERRKEEFAYGLSRFLEEGKTLAKFRDHPGNVAVIAFFKANDTGYLVMEYKEKVDDFDSNKMRLVTCPKCWAKNEIPANKPPEEVSCSSCGKPLASPKNDIKKKNDLDSNKMTFVTCPKCWTKNEFPSNKPMEEVSCKKCGNSLTSQIKK
ncbi:MAG: hypothetical protein GTN82_16125 [Candidatus Aminicenantes bacterium]|nr:hypothetical protein [Candidatus Aminicenantes bacterium]NIN43364.1 hypothetical protein [Candidatus Aminicenantes bacterium]NIR06945.1 hypothetical protein [Candidatus Aminicenantes bacterium]